MKKIIAALLTALLILPSAAVFGASGGREVTVILDGGKGTYEVSWRGEDGTAHTGETNIAPKTTVAIVFAPDAGYQTDTVTARTYGTPDLSPVTVQRKAENTVSFIMPDANVAVNVTFQKTAAVKPGKLRIIRQPQPQTAEAGGDVAFEVGALGGKGMTFQWYAEGDLGLGKITKAVKLSDTPGKVKEPPIVSGAQTNTLTLRGVTLAMSNTRYYCAVSDNNAVINSDTAVLRVEKPGAAGKPPVIVGDLAGAEFAEGKPIVFTVVAEGDGILHYEWSVAGQSGTEVLSDDTPSVTITGKAEYAKHNGLFVSVRVVSEYGDAASAQAEITVKKAAGSSGGSSGGGSHTPSVPAQPTQPIPSAPPAQPVVFTDVAITDWFYEDVYHAVGMGVVNGTSAATYSPYMNLTIAEAIKLAACIHQKHHTGGVTLANGTENWYDAYVAYAEQNGIIQQGEYFDRYNDYAARAEFVWIFYPALPALRHDDRNKIAEGAIPDVDFDARYYGVVYAFYRAGILVGSDSRGTFYPERSIERSEVAAILSRMMDNGKRKTITLP